MKIKQVYGSHSALGTLLEYVDFTDLLGPNSMVNSNRVSVRSARVGVVALPVSGLEPVTRNHNSDERPRILESSRN